MRNSRDFLKIGMTIFFFLNCSSNALLAIESGYITYAAPDPLYCKGSVKNVTVQIVNTGDDGYMIIRPDSIPSGWNVSPTFIRVLLTSGSIHNAVFTVTPSSNNSSGTIVWNLYYDRLIYPDILLDTYVQTVFNTMPVQIDSVLPNPAQSPVDIVHFRGTGGNYAVQWEWKSNLDGILSTAEDFDKSSNLMTIGSHVIEFRVRHSHTGLWSSPATMNLTINGTPMGYIVDVSPDPLYCEGSEENVTVRIRNTGPIAGDMIIGPDSIPPGWNVSPGFLTQYISPGGDYITFFTVTPPPNNSFGTIVWKLYYDNHGASQNTLLDTYNQSVFNTMPVQIDSVLPNPAQPPSNMVQFRGTGGNYAVQWEWKSNLDGILSTVEDFDKSSYQMTVGSHNIEFRVRHSHTGLWSAPDTVNLVINNALPTALHPSGLPDSVPCGSTICLGLDGHDNDENGYAIVQREVSIVGIGTYTTSSDNLCFPVPVAPGDYELRYRIQDDEGSWSSPVIHTLQVVCPPVISPIPDEISSEQFSYVGPTPELVQGSTPIIWSLVVGPNDMFIDTSTGIVQWDEPNIDGSPHTITIRATNSAGYDDETWSLTISFSDFDNSGKVDSGDFSILAYYWMEYICSEPDWCEGCDYNKDTHVNIYDLKVFTEDWLWEY